MLQLVEMEGKMTENGCIEIPAVVLEQAGICTGDTVKLVYMAEDGELKNTAKEFLLARAGQDVAEELAKEENIAFQIPEELLRDAGIPMDADLDIVCQEGRIIILPSELVQGTEVPEELLATKSSYNNEITRAYSEYFKESRPCCTWIGIKELNRPTQLVEIEMQAIVGAKA